jgi:hypothetical protein
MLERTDMVFGAALERWILRELNGDGEKYEGLMRAILAAQDWETVCRTKGIIFAYERVLEVMRDIAREINEPDRRKEEPKPMRPN